jgi:hypothetical protein
MRPASPRQPNFFPSGIVILTQCEAIGSQKEGLDHPMTRKQVAWLRIPGDCCMAHVDHRTLNIHVPQAILPEGHIDSRVK